MIPTVNTIPYKATPTVTYALMASCAVVFVYQLSLSSAAEVAFLRDYALVPARYTDPGWSVEYGLARFNVIPFVTSMFLHGGIFHIAANMWTLWVFGPALEDRIGGHRFALLYLLSGLAAGLAHMFFNLSSDIPTLGASGAIAGVIGAYVHRFPYAWINVLQPIGLFPVFLYMPAVLFAAIWFLTQLMQATSSTLMPGIVVGVAWWAHIGGFVAGWFLLPLLAPAAAPAEEAEAAAESFFWPWRQWLRWMEWWWRR